MYFIHGIQIRCAAIACNKHFLNTVFATELFCFGQTIFYEPIRWFIRSIQRDSVQDLSDKI